MEEEKLLGTKINNGDISAQSREDILGTLKTEEHADATYQHHTAINPQNIIKTDPDKRNNMMDYINHPSAPLASTIQNYIQIIMNRHPWITQEEAVNILDKYLRPQVITVKDKNWNPEDVTMYSVDDKKFLVEELNIDIEQEQEKDQGKYNSASVNSEKNGKITAIWYNS